MFDSNYWNACLEVLDYILYDLGFEMGTDGMDSEDLFLLMSCISDTVVLYVKNHKKEFSKYYEQKRE